MLEGSPSGVAHICAINMHSNWYCMVEESPHNWFTCVAISVHGGSLHMWVTCVAISMNHMLIQVPSYWTQFLKKKNQNSTWKSLHVSDNIVSSGKSLHISHNIAYSQMCHKYIHITAWKDQNKKKK